MTLTDPVSPDLKRHLRTLKLGQLLAVLPDRLTLARHQKLPHADFLELLPADWTPGTPPPPSATTSSYGTSSSASASPKPPTAL